MSTPETFNNSAENLETPKVSAEQYENIEKNLEDKAERGVESAEKREASARTEALKQAVSVESGSAEKKRKTNEGPSPAKRRGGVTKKERDASFTKRMSHVQAEMSAPERAFSKFIHSKPVEKTSAVVGSTVARPNAILAGAIVAFLAVLAVYLLARHLGYVLSGFETIAAFIVGWVLGLLYDFFRVMITGKK